MLLSPLFLKVLTICWNLPLASYWNASEVTAGYWFIRTNCAALCRVTMTVPVFEFSGTVAVLGKFTKLWPSNSIWLVIQGISTNTTKLGILNIFWGGGYITLGKYRQFCHWKKSGCFFRGFYYYFYLDEGHVWVPYLLDVIKVYLINIKIKKSICYTLQGNIWNEICMVNMTVPVPEFSDTVAVLGKFPTLGSSWPWKVYRAYS